MSEKLIRASFETRLAAWGVAQSMPIAFENAPFTAVEGNYAQSFLLPGATQSYDLAGQLRDFVGLFQVNLVLSTNTGTSDAEDLAQSLDDAFPTGAPYTYGGFRVWVTKPMSPGPMLPGADNFTVPVSCRYAAALFLN